MKFIGLGSNLPSQLYGPPQNTLEAALNSFVDWGIKVCRVSSWYKSTPVPISEQPSYINAVAQITSSHAPHELIEVLLAIENFFGRVRSKQNEARIIDLDLLTFEKKIINGIIKNGIQAFIPHPRMSKRRFVLEPIQELCPNWIHPKSGRSIENLINNLPKDQVVIPFKNPI